MLGDSKKLVAREFQFDRETDYDVLIEERWNRILSNIESIRMDPKQRPIISEVSPYFQMVIDEVGESEKERSLALVARFGAECSEGQCFFMPHPKIMSRSTRLVKMN